MNEMKWKGKWIEKYIEVLKKKKKVWDNNDWIWMSLNFCDKYCEDTWCKNEISIASKTCGLEI